MMRLTAGNFSTLVLGGYPAHDAQGSSTATTVVPPASLEDGFELSSVTKSSRPPEGSYDAVQSALHLLARSVFKVLCEAGFTLPECTRFASEFMDKIVTETRADAADHTEPAALIAFQPIEIVEETSRSVSIELAAKSVLHRLVADGYLRIELVRFASEIIQLVSEETRAAAEHSKK